MNTGVDFRVTGRVQGVAFRAFVQRTASQYGLTGWVKNNVDGSVSGYAEGDDGLVRDLMKEIKIGNTPSRVSSMEYDLRPYTGEYESFEIRY